MVKWLHVLLVSIPVAGAAQIGGRSTYDFLNLSPTARIASLGGVNITTVDHDQNFGYLNPALVNEEMHGRVSLSFVNYLSDISYGYSSYSNRIKNVGHMHAGIQYLSYGKMIAADPYGNKTGEFNAGDIAVVGGVSRSFDRLSGGMNLKLVNSRIADYSSTGLLVDFGGVYYDSTARFSAAVVMKNIGGQLTRYSPSGIREEVPFEIQLGISKQPKHLPMRFSLTGVHLEKPKLLYEPEDAEPETDLNGEEIKPRKRTFEKVVRHVVIGTEFIISRNVHLRAGYNHMRRQELKTAGSAGIAGFAFGFGIRISRFTMDYAYSNFHDIGGVSHFSLSTVIGRKAAPVLK